VEKVNTKNRLDSHSGVCGESAYCFEKRQQRGSIMLAFPGFGAKGECQENRPDPHHVQNLVEKVTAREMD
jgi:hypothetical protein